MRKHTIEATGGKTYSQMDRFLDESGKPTAPARPRQRANSVTHGAGCSVYLVKTV